MLLRSRRALRLSARALAVTSSLAALAGCLLRRVEVRGDSMRPTLLPGDRLLVVRLARPREGDVVVVADPRWPDRALVKRVAAVAPGRLTVVGDNEAASTDSAVFGPLSHALGRAVYRYHPPARAGRVR